MILDLWMVIFFRWYYLNLWYGFVWKWYCSPHFSHEDCLKGGDTLPHFRTKLYLWILWMWVHKYIFNLVQNGWFDKFIARKMWFIPSPMRLIVWLPQGKLTKKCGKRMVSLGPRTKDLYIVFFFRIYMLLQRKVYFLAQPWSLWFSMGIITGLVERDRREHLSDISGNLGFLQATTGFCVVMIWGCLKMGYTPNEIAI